MRSLTGTMDQVPPPFSAKKIGGVPSYKLARKNQAVEIASSRVQVHEFEAMVMDGNRLAFRVVCSPGTYIRSLAHDLGTRAGCGAHLSVLRRTRSGTCRIEDAVTLDKASSADLIPMDEILESLPRIEVSGVDETKVLHGNQVRGAADAQLARIFNKEGQFLAVASIESGWVRPRVVLT